MGAATFRPSSRKAAKTPRYLVFTRDKWEHQIGGRRPDLDVARDAALGPVFSKKVRHSLKPILETRVRRTVYPIQSGDSEIELTIDCRH